MEASMDATPFPAWSWSVEQCLKEYKVKLDKGLSSYDVEKRRERYGWNELKKEKGKPLWRLVLEQFDDMLVKILLVAACISFILAYLHGNENGAAYQSIALVAACISVSCSCQVRHAPGCC
ncbi:unnamed protein product [Ilex paraguariensis]|uniref:Cation-transporting P-type ATPase N-terminal domain-containing protein n=1 Tax=Ilex paraguariensis TaxID=185542 RepID=A0ABC8RTZ9_9AQUA